MAKELIVSGYLFKYTALLAGIAKGLPKGA
jgi:hypothetical protein